MRYLMMLMMGAALVLLAAPGCSQTQTKTTTTKAEITRTKRTSPEKKSASTDKSTPAAQSASGPTAYDSTFIQKDQTLYSLAQKHDVTVDALLAANDHIENPRDIEVGEIVLIPVKGGASAAKKADGSAKKKTTDEESKTRQSSPEKQQSSTASESSPEPKDVPDSALHRGNPDARFWWPTAGEVIPDSQSNLRKSDEPGIGIAAPGGQEVCAVADGKIIASLHSGRIGGGGRGHVVVIRHNKKMVSWYGLLGKRTAREGQKVKQGQRIGLVSPKGVDGRTQLEFKMFRNEKEIDPVSQLP